jgi:hypothetical protein
MAGRTFRESGFTADAPVGAAGLLYSIGDLNLDVLGRVVGPTGDACPE